jgi:hypothetical protein
MLGYLEMEIHHLNKKNMIRRLADKLRQSKPMIVFLKIYLTLGNEANNPKGIKGWQNSGFHLPMLKDQWLVF